MLAVTVTAYANDWYNGDGVTHIQPLVAGGIATLILGGIGAIPQMNGLATGIGWAAFLGYLLAGGAGKGTPVGNLVKISQGKG